MSLVFRIFNGQPGIEFIESSGLNDIMFAHNSVALRNVLGLTNTKE